jgi:hypothetical protein
MGWANRGVPTALPVFARVAGDHLEKRGAAIRRRSRPRCRGSLWASRSPGVTLHRDMIFPAWFVRNLAPSIGVRARHDSEKCDEAAMAPRVMRGEEDREVVRCR